MSDSMLYDDDLGSHLACRSSSHTKFKSLPKTRTFEINLKHSNSSISSFILMSDLDTIYADYDSSDSSDSSTSSTSSTSTSSFDDYHIHVGVVNSTPVKYNAVSNHCHMFISPSMNKSTSLELIHANNNSETVYKSQTTTTTRNIFHHIINSTKLSTHKRGNSTITDKQQQSYEFIPRATSTPLPLETSQERPSFHSKFTNYRRFFPKPNQILHKL